MECMATQIIFNPTCVLLRQIIYEDLIHFVKQRLYLQANNLSASQEITVL
jgi:hypothetical protein